ncbi:MAG: diacylglycerol kinase family protein [Spirochaetes bacterium]|jgi:diacylglycerol kinase (ATP)|nr:diacylglycerol kinase family protein [Spirochaetota bacterium]
MSFSPYNRKKPVIGIIVNPYSRKNLRTKCASVELFTVIGQGRVDVRTTSSLEDLDRVLIEFKEKNYEYIGISGGDGTIHNVISRLIQLYRPAPVPGILLLNDGTMNNIAVSIGLKGDSSQILRSFLHMVDTTFIPRMVTRDTLKIGEKYCFLFGFGMVANFLNECYSDGKKGFRKNISAIGKTVTETIGDVLNNLTLKKESELSVMRSMDATIHIDSQRIGFRKVLFVLAGTVEQVGMGFKTLYRADDMTSSFHCLINGMRPLDVVTQLSRFAAGSRVENNLNIDEVVSLLEVEIGEPFEFTMDGDMYLSDGSLTIETGLPMRFVLV